MTGIAITSTQANGVTTTFATVMDYRCQPYESLDVQVGYFIDEATFLAGGRPVHTQYVSLDVTQLVADGNIPLQIFTQLMASGAPLNGGTLV